MQASGEGGELALWSSLLVQLKTEGERGRTPRPLVPARDDPICRRHPLTLKEADLFISATG